MEFGLYHPDEGNQLMRASLPPSWGLEPSWGWSFTTKHDKLMCKFMGKWPTQECVNICRDKIRQIVASIFGEMSHPMKHRRLWHNLISRLSGAVKNHGEGLKAMAGLIPESTAEEGDESIKMQVTDFKSEILKILQCSACPCTPSCLPWATQPSTISLSTSREQSCQCWRQCHGTKWI